ncbi:hypothetical protein [Lactobacillus kitasatonis]|uniref:hypothetical protein n=1 Tax=Lactobacillus kitasatonis TaxID=237446 RepID=UPI0026EE73E5|nr:hypothetical protein [Lactobacillus kitasatonis]
MANDQLVLQINKINISPDKSYVKYNQNERGKVIDINVIDNDGINAYNLTGKKIRFVDDKEDNKLILDDEADNPNRFTRTDDAQGKFSYTLNDLTYQRAGIARFEIYTDADHIDATSNFEIQIETTSSLSVSNESYISSLESLVAHYRSAINTTETETDQLIDSLNKQIAQAISDGNKSVADEVSSIKEIIQQMQTEYKSKSDALAKFTSDWQTQTQTIQNNADDQLKQINENANTEIDKLKQDAADQLKSNQTANDAEINSVKQQLSDELAKVETDKTTAIQGITNARDKAISDAKDQFKANLQSIQADYDKWKTSTTGDFQAQIDKLSKELADDEADQASLKQAIDSAKEAVNKLHDIDFTVYAHKSDLDNYYTKAESDQKLGQKITFVKCDSPQAAHDASMNPAADGSIVFGIYDMNDEPSQAVVGDQKINIEWLYNHLNDLSTQVSGLSSLQSLINGKADSATVYTKSDTDSIVNTLKGLIAGKANSADVYTKSDTDNIVNILKELIANAGKVKTVNGTQPDSSGNIAITIPDISGKADKNDVNNLQNKVTSQEIEIADLKKSGTKLVAVTQAQYDQLVKDGEVQQNVIYAVSNS